MKKNIKIITLLILITIVLTFIFQQLFAFRYQTSGFISNNFKVSMNNSELNYFIHEEYSLKIIPLFFEGTRTLRSEWAYPNEGNMLNEMEKENLYRLSIQEYECLMKDDVRTNCKETDNYKERNVNTNIKKLTIWHKNKIIHRGKYIENLSNLIKEGGHYHFKISIKSGNSNVDLIFNIKVVADGKNI